MNTITDARLRERVVKFMSDFGISHFHVDDWILELSRSIDASARAEQREADAKIARDFIEKGVYANTCLDIAAAIRAQGGGERVAGLRDALVIARKNLLDWNLLYEESPEIKVIDAALAEPTG